MVVLYNIWRNISDNMGEALTNCPICDFPGIKQFSRSGDMYFMQCARCGEYEISWELLKGFVDVKDKINEVGYILSGLSRELNETGNKYPTFTIKNLEADLKHYLIPNIKSIEEKVQKFLQRVREKTKYFGEEIKLGDIETVVSLAYAKNSDELIALFTLITEKKMARIGVIKNENDDGKHTVKITLSVGGWDLTNSLEDKNKESDRGFVAVWFHDSMNKNIDAIEEAISESGFLPICIRDKHFPERIMDKALGEIRRSKFVIVDLTGNRGSVFFEAGFAYGLGIETIYIYCDKSNSESTPLEFYVRHYQCYKYKTPSDLKETLKAAISARMKISK